MDRNFCFLGLPWTSAIYINENSQKIPILIFHLEKQKSNVTSEGGDDVVTVPGSANNPIL